MQERRLFLGIAIEGEARQAVAAYVESVDAKMPLPGKRHPPENWHVTLEFLGQVTAERHETLIRAMDHAVLGAAFHMTLAGLSTFPEVEAARVLWLGVGDGQLELARLQGVVQTATVASGHQPLDRAFTPHLTLVRLPRAENLRALTAAAPVAGISCLVDRVVLFESRPGSLGVEYVPHRFWPLSAIIV